VLISQTVISLFYRHKLTNQPMRPLLGGVRRETLDMLDDCKAGGVRVGSFNDGWTDGVKLNPPSRTDPKFC